MEFDVFICHASEDKDSFVRELANGLQREHLRVWYDEFELRLGDSIRRTIDKGLSKSRYGIVVLSAAFFAKQWTQYELDGLVEIEMAKKEKAILPVWHGVTYDQVFMYSPPLASRKAAISAAGFRQVISQIVSVVRPEKDPIVVASNVLESYGVAPPVANDKRWIDIATASTRFRGSSTGQHKAAWTFPLDPEGVSPEQVGRCLAFTELQTRWLQSVKSGNAGVTNTPDEVWNFIEQSPVRRAEQY